MALRNFWRLYGVKLPKLTFCLQVAKALDRRPKWPKYYSIKCEDDLLRELRSTQLQLFGATKQMPSRSQLCASGRQELLQAINDSGILPGDAVELWPIQSKPVDLLLSSC